MRDTKATGTGGWVKPGRGNGGFTPLALFFAGNAIARQGGSAATRQITRKSSAPAKKHTSRASSSAGCSAPQYAGHDPRQAGPNGMYTVGASGGYADAPQRRDVSPGRPSSRVSQGGGVDPNQPSARFVDGTFFQGSNSANKH